jgi:peptidoglycan/LPS O-acetylase OafA/YrhL
MDRVGFEPRLESLRGIAALIVAMHHGMSAFATMPSEYSGLIGTLIVWLLWVTNPAASVMFFFVLSGYVLGLALERSGGFIPFVIRRCFRILPMFVLSVLFAYACVTLVRIDPAPSGLATYFQQIFWPGPQVSDLLDNLTFNNFLVNGPSWSIYPEIIGSLLLPPLVYVHRLVNARWRWLLFVVVTAMLAFTKCRFVIWFYCGFFLPGEIAKLPMNGFSRALTFVAGYLIERYTSGFPLEYKFYMILPSSIGGAMMIGAVIWSPTFLSWLSAAQPRFVGRVSYSFYLLHWPIFYLTAIGYLSLGIPLGFPANLVVCITSIAAALCASSITYSVIERPAMNLGRRITRAKTSAPLDRPLSTQAGISQ